MHSRIFTLLTSALLAGFFAVHIQAPAQEDAPAQPAAAEQKRADLFYPADTVPISVIVDDFTEQTGVRIQLRGKASAVKTAFSGNQLTAEAFLSAISNASKTRLKWRQVADGYELWDEESYVAEVLPTLVQQKVFIPVHISAKYLHDAIRQSNALTERIGNVALDERTNKVIVSDLPEKLALVQDMVNLLDEPQITRIFRIRYANIQKVVEKISQFKSEAGSIEFDEMNRFIIVRDVFNNIQQMEVMVDLLDIRQPRRVYNLNTIDFAGAELDKLLENLKLIITLDAFMVIDDSRGLLILEDTPEVHEDVEKFLRVFDRPVDQVRIDAELLDVDQNTSLEYGASFTISEDLPSAVADGLVSNFATGSAPGNPFGFINYRDEFPIVSAGGGGLNVSYLNSRIKAQLNAALTDNNTRVLLQPRVTVKNREEVTLGAIRSTAITQLTPLSYGATLSSNYAVSPSSVPSGLTVTLQPTISPTGLVEMTINIVNSVATPVQLPTGEGDRTITGVNTTEDNFNTVLIIPDGETRVISGLIDRREEELKSGVPFLVQIPIIGPLLFGTKTDRDRTRNLVFFITPTIIRERGKGSVVAYEFDEMIPSNTWESSSVEARPQYREREDIFYDEPLFEIPLPPAMEDETTTPTTMRFPAPTPEEFEESRGGGVGEPAFPKPGAGRLEDVPNTLDGLSRALHEGGGDLPEFGADRKPGWTSLPPAPTEAPKPGTPPAPGVRRPAPGRAAPRPGTPPAPAEEQESAPARSRITPPPTVAPPVAPPTGEEAPEIELPSDETPTAPPPPETPY